MVSRRQLLQAGVRVLGEAELQLLQVLGRIVPIHTPPRPQSGTTVDRGMKKAADAGRSASPFLSLSEADSTEPDTDTDADQPRTFEVGEKATDDDYQFTVTKIRCGVKRVGSSYYGEKAQGEFCLVSMRIKNVGDEPINYSEENQALIDTRGREYSPDDEAWIHLDGSAPWGEINPGNTQKAVIAFDIPKKAKPDHLLLKAGVWGASDGVVVKL